MSQPFNPENIFDSKQRADAEFGTSECVAMYERLAQFGLLDKDATVAQNALTAVAAAMQIERRSDVNTQTASTHLINQLERNTIGSS